LHEKQKRIITISWQPMAGPLKAKSIIFKVQLYPQNQKLLYLLPEHLEEIFISLSFKEEKIH
jgi:hypothetical protein